MRLWHLGILAVLGVAVGQTPAPSPLTQAEKNQLLSRKKWYLTYDVSLSGQGASGDRTWKISAQSGGTIELNLVNAGQFPPLSSTAADAAEVLKPGRFIGWMAAPTDETYRRIEAGEQNPARLEGLWFPYQRQVDNHATSGNRQDTWRGAGTGFAIGTCQFVLDLQKGTYDLVFQVGGTDLGSTVRHVWRSPENSGEEDSPPSHHYAWLAKEWAEQFAGRKIRTDMKADGSFSLSFQGPVKLATGPSGGSNVNFMGSIKISPTPPTQAALTLSHDDPAFYAKWRPRPGEDEDDAGSGLLFQWEVTEPGVPEAERAKVRKVTFRLSGVSRYPGVCMNWPPPAPPAAGAAAAAPKPDLRFLSAKDRNHPDYTVEDEELTAIMDGALAEKAKGTIYVRCYDGAAIGDLTATAELSDGRMLTCQVQGQSGSNKILIPSRDEGVSDLAKEWRSRRVGDKPDNADDETDPVGDSNAPGDGLSVWEEYRGFYQGGEWQDNCFPKKKDLFVINKIGARAEGGIELFQDRTGVVVHEELLDNEADQLLVINFHKRSDRQIVEQHCLRMKAVAGNNSGYTLWMPGRQFPGPPKNTFAVRVAFASGNLAQALATVRPLTDWDDRLVAHELGHGVGIYHHGDKDPYGGVMWYRGTSTAIPLISNPVDAVFENSPTGAKIQVLKEAGLVPYPNADLFGAANELKVDIGVPSGQHSGNWDCIMRYCIADAYVRTGVAFTRVAHYQIEPHGTTFCSSPVGTGLNDANRQPQPRYGPADTKRGDCIHQFVISDKYDKQYR